MPTFGDVLRGLGSVLNPQVAQELAQEDAQKAGTERQLQTLALQQRMQQASPEYQAKMEALKNEKAFREEVSQADGDQMKILSAATKYKPELAVTMYNRQEDRAARLQQAKEALEVRLAQLQQQGANQDAMLEIRRQGMALQAEIAKSNQELKRMQFTMKADQQLQKSVQQLGGALEKANLPEADATLAAVEDILKKNPGIAEYISGPKSAIPDMALNSEITAARQAFNKLFNVTLKLRSGAAVTQQELDRLKQEFGVGITKKPEQVGKAVEQARNIIAKHYKSVAGGFGTDALNAYNENIRGVGGRPVLDAADVPKVIDFGSLK